MYMGRSEPRMHFDRRTQRVLRGFLSAEELRAASEEIVAATRREAEQLEDVFDGLDTVYSDMDRAHSNAEHPEHTVSYLDLYTHAADIRGYLRFDTWGVPVEGGRVLDGDLVELTLGPTVHGRVRFATDRDAF